MAPLLRPASGPDPAAPAAAPPASPGAEEDGETGKPPLPPGPKLTYTVPNPAIAASTAATR